MSEVTVHALFPTPVCVFEFKPSVDLELFLQAQSTLSVDLPKEITHSYGTYSSNIKILKRPECAQLRQFILEKCRIFGNKVLGYDVQEYVDTISWVSTKRPNEAHVPHSHPNSIISGVYYFDDNLESCPITFSDPSTTPSGKNNTMHVVKNKSSDSTFAADHVTINVRKGELILFPSYLKHMVEVNNTSKNRYSLAFNVVPRYSVGSYSDLTLFEYGDGI